MKKQKILLIFFIILAIILIPNIVKAAEKYTAQTVVNGENIEWSYNLNESDQIINLVCVDKDKLLGNVTIPETIDGKSVIGIGYHAFENCTKLTGINLGKITSMGNEVFKGCTSLTEITIPKTLKDTSYGAPLDNPNITKITLEEGMTIVPSQLCANTGITEIVIPNTVTKIEYGAFKNCTKLSEVDLGKITSMGNGVFKGCTSLTEITIPKTLKDTSYDAPLDNPNITKITLDEGMTVIPKYLCKNTGITEITIPKTVTKIEGYAFENCTKLKKITILDNVKEMSGTGEKDDLVFRNHNEDLTIYCYEDSEAASYAINHNIKYVYLKRQQNEKPKEENKEEVKNPEQNDDKKEEINHQENIQKPTNDDSTKATGTLPYTGGELVIILSALAIVGLGIYLYRKNKDLRGI